jgi:hypothetical protein
MRAKYTKVRARSANEGSGTAGWSLTGPVPACFLIDEEDITVTFWQFKGNPVAVKRGGARGGRECFIGLGRNRVAMLLPNVHLTYLGGCTKIIRSIRSRLR